MKYSQLLICAIFTFCSACATLKTRKEAAEEEQSKAASGEEPEGTPLTAIPEEGEEPESYPAAAEMPPQPPVEDQVLDDELAAMGVDPENPSGANEGTPEPEIQQTSPVPEPSSPVAKPGPRRAAPTNKMTRSQRIKAAAARKKAAKKAAMKKKPGKKQTTKKKKKLGQ